jgi:hypothetical protein
MAISSSFMTLDDLQPDSNYLSFPQNDQSYEQSSRGAHVQRQAEVSQMAQSHDDSQVRSQLHDQMRIADQNTSAQYAANHALAPPANPVSQIEMMQRQLMSQHQLMPQHQPLRVNGQNSVESYNDSRGEQSYITTLLSKKRDIMKLMVLTGVILLALSVHGVVCHYCNLYFDSSDLGFWQGLGLRILYPTIVVFIVWNIKAFMPGQAAGRGSI